jgi:hypothetical protein
MGRIEALSSCEVRFWQRRLPGIISRRSCCVNRGNYPRFISSPVSVPVLVPNLSVSIPMRWSMLT